MESVQQLPPSVQPSVQPQTTTQVRGRSSGRATGMERLLVVCVLFDSADVLPPLLTSLPAGLDGVDWDLVLVDNASRDGSAELARTLAPWATVVESPLNRGYAAGINAGVAAHPGHHTAVLVLNPDVRLAPGCGRTLLAALRETRAGIAVPVLRDERGHLLHSLRREPTVLRQAADTFIGARTAGRIGTLGELVANRSSYRTRHVVDWAEGALLLIDAGCMAATGGWDEAYFLYSEETDFALRARDLGYATVFEPAAEAVHLRGGSATDPGLWALLCRNRVRAFRQRHGLASSALFYGLVVLREASRAGLGRPTSKAALTLPARPAADASTARSLVRPAQSGAGGHRPGHTRDDHLLGAGLLVPQPRALGCAAGTRAVRRPAGAARQQPGHADAPPRYVDPTDPPDPAQGGQQLARCAPAREPAIRAWWS